MNRTKWGARWARRVSGALCIAIAGVACTSAPPDRPDAWPPSCCGEGVICECDGGPRPDVPPIDTGPPPLGCAGNGRVGTHCRSGSANRCVTGATCLDTPVTTVQAAFMLRQAGDVDPAHPGYVLARDPAIPADDAPLNGAEGSLCAQRCDPAAVTDTCGPCATCSADMTQMPLVAALGGAATVLAASGGPRALCRLDCTWSATAASPECPAQMACDALDAVCIEACTDDDECNTGVATSYAGELLTSLETAHPRHCNVVTGRCESTGSASAQVGDPCTRDDDCAAGTGVCLAGGHCAELGCANPNTATSTCGGASQDRGVCLTTSASSSPTALCLLGCNAASDCGAGNRCNRLADTAGATVTIGTFTGYCIGVCESDDQCIASEACTDGTDAMGVTHPGRCVPRCTGVGLVGAASGGCMASELCEADHAGAAYGHCAPADRFCGAGGTVGLVAASSDCATGWVCDELLAGVAGSADVLGDGHCARACASDGDCTIAGRTCVTSGVYAGLCRHACTTATDCAAAETCISGWCVER